MRMLKIDHERPPNFLLERLLPEDHQDFPSFQVTRAYKRWMHGPPLPLYWLPFGRLLGWHLWIHLTPTKPAR